jgi:hypothetical protein
MTFARSVSVRCRIVVVVALAALCGCSDPAFWSGVAAGAAQASAPQQTVASTELLVFGGKDHDVFLGCLNCSEYSSNSVLNQYGRFGNPYSSTSILNAYSPYGSKYSSYSACNEYASSPPVVVDRSGNFFGHLTVSEYKNPLRSDVVRAWLAGVCASH